VTLESLNKDNELKTIIKDLVRWGGRSIPPEDSQVEASLISTSSSADAVSEKQQFAGISEKINHPSESNGVPSKGPLAVR
jgi:hypothetical protein